MRVYELIGMAVIAAAASSAAAVDYQCRWVECVGNMEVPIEEGMPFDIRDGRARQVRLQFGVFDSDSGPAPAGGLLGWSNGMLVATGGINTRTPGRLEPFNSATNPLANGDPPLPGGDPFQTLTSIDATRGPQSPFWGFDGNGIPLPQPGPLVLGLNTFVSLYEITVQAAPDGGDYTITASGELRGVVSWETLGEPIPPDPASGTPGLVTYTPVATINPTMFACDLTIGVPAPGGVAAAIIGVLMGAGRRRR